MTLHEYRGKDVVVILKTGQVFSGKAKDYIPPQDNEDGIASISIGDYEIYANEISEIIIK